MARQANKPRLKEPVKVRTKKLADGSLSYYLDIYVGGKRTYEFLKLYHLPEINAKIKEQNRATLEAVETIKSRRIIEITNNKAGLKKTSVRSKILLMDWLQTYYEAQVKKGSRGVRLLKTVMSVVREFTQGKKVRMGDIDKEWCVKFVNWLRTGYKGRFGKPISATSAADYLKYFSVALNAAVRAEVIPENPLMKLNAQDRIQIPPSKREFLTIDELKLMIATDAPRLDVKQAYLFACYCGLRLSDVFRLRWGDLAKDGDQWRASVVMHKTQRPLMLPLSAQAMKWLPERGDAKDDDVIFATLPAEQNININLQKWAKAAGITKHISFHTSRHTSQTSINSLVTNCVSV